MAREELAQADPVALETRVPGAALAEAYRRGFVAVTSLIERLNPDAPRVGGVGPAAEEAIRFRHDPTLRFSAGDVAAVRARELRSNPADPLSPTRTLYEIVTTFLGLSGTVTPLPTYIAEEVALEDDEGGVRREFLDIFHHRILSLLYRLLVKFDFPREFVSDGADAWSRRVLALTGVDAYDRMPGRGLSPLRMLRLSAIFGNRARTASALQLVLEDVLGDALEGARVSVEQFVGQWTALDEPLQVKLGTQNSQLGVNMVIGAKAYDRFGRFRIKLAPFKTDAYRRFLADGDLLPVVRETVSGFLTDPLAYELELTVAAGATPAMKLTRQPQFRLGENTWLGGRKFVETKIPVEVEGG